MDVDMSPETSEGGQVGSSGAGEAGTSGGEAGTSGGEAGTCGGGGASEAGMCWTGEAGTSGRGDPAQGETKKEDSRRKRKHKSSTGGVTAKKIKTGVAKGPENPYQADGDDGIAELLDGMAVQGPGDDNAVAASRRSKFNHQRAVWWTTTNWHDVRKTADYGDGNGAMASCSRSRRIAQSRENGAGAGGATYNRVPEPLILEPPREPVFFDREDAENFAACARLSRRNRQRRLAVSDSDTDVEHAQEEIEKFLLFREQSVVSSETSDSLYSSLGSSSSDSSECSSKIPSEIEGIESDESTLGLKE